MSLMLASYDISPPSLTKSRTPYTAGMNVGRAASRRVKDSRPPAGLAGRQSRIGTGNDQSSYPETLLPKQSRDLVQSERQFNYPLRALVLYPDCDGRRAGLKPHAATPAQRVRSMRRLPTSGFVTALYSFDRSGRLAHHLVGKG